MMRSASGKSAKRLLRAIAFVAVLGIAYTINVAYANSVYLVYDHRNGTTIWVSCGSSAGNTLWTCTSSGCVAHYDDPGGANQEVANQLCAGQGVIAPVESAQ